jgi:antitoxin ParD1/3/4
LTGIGRHHKLEFRRFVGQMNTMNISLPEMLKDFVDQQVASGRYSSASEYVRELIREDEKRKAQERLEAMLLEGLNSDAAEMKEGDWEEIRREGLARIQARRSSLVIDGKTNPQAARGRR